MNEVYCSAVVASHMARMAASDVCNRPDQVGARLPSYIAISQLLAIELLKQRPPHSFRDPNDLDPSLDSRTHAFRPIHAELLPDLFA